MEIADVLSVSSQTVGLFKSATELVKNIRDVATSARPDRKEVIDSTVETLRDKLTDLQQKHVQLQQLALASAQVNLSLAEKNRDLEKQLAQLEKFEAERHLFERVALALNTSAYREKDFEGPADGQPLFCPQCFDRSKKVYLSFDDYAVRTNRMKCTDCGTTAHVPRDDGPGVHFAHIPNRWDGY